MRLVYQWSLVFAWKEKVGIGEKQKQTWSISVTGEEHGLRAAPL